MGRSSTIDRLPPDILKQLNVLLADPRCSQVDAAHRINFILSQEGHGRVSKSAVNRYAIRMNEVGRRLKERHQVADIWVGRFGRLPQGQMGQLIIQMVHGLAFDAGMKLSEGEMDAENMPGTVKMLKDLAVMLERTERAASLNADREKDIRKQAAEEAAEAAEKTLASQGMSRNSIDTLKREILGIA